MIYTDPPCRWPRSRPSNSRIIPLGYSYRDRHVGGPDRGCTPNMGWLVVRRERGTCKSTATSDPPKLTILKKLCIDASFKNIRELFDIYRTKGMMRTIPFRNGSRSRVEGHATAGEGTRLKGIVLCPFSRNLPYEYIRNTVRHSRWGTVEKWQRPQVKTCVHGPPWDYKAFEKFDFSMIGHFDENGKTLKSISRFEHMYYTISVSYWLILLISVLSGNKLLAQLAQFRVFVTAMCASSFAFASWFAARLIKDVRQHLEQNEMDQDISGLYRYAWRAIFWLAFVMFYTVPPVYSLTAYFAIPGAVMCLYGLALAGFSALIVGTVCVCICCSLVSELCWVALKRYILVRQASVSIY